MINVKPIIFSTPMVNALAHGAKRQTRRLMKVPPDFLYSLTDDAIIALHTNKEVVYELNKISIRSGIAVDSCFSELGLYGWFRWQNILTDEIQGLWEKGVRGLVCVARASNKQAVFNCIIVSQKQKDYKIGASAHLHGVSRDAAPENSTGAPFGREQQKQCSRESDMGNLYRKLDGQESAWQRTRVGKASLLETDECRTSACQMGDRERSLQPASSSAITWDEPICHTAYSRFFPGMILYVREGFLYRNNKNAVVLRAGMDAMDAAGMGAMYGGWKPSIHMPRWASRLTLEITGVRVQRLQEISEEDAVLEGVKLTPNGWVAPLIQKRVGDFEAVVYLETARAAFAFLWDFIHGENGWMTNPWVWALDFDVRHQNVDDYLSTFNKERKMP